MAWVLLFLAGLMEIAWAVALKYSEQFTHLIPSLVFLVTAPASILLLGFSMKYIPLGTAYAVWTGIGATGVAIIGMVFLNDPVTLIRVLLISVIIACVIGLKVTAGG